ncbi:type II toxin-antitoxin system ParD family antitoxin [Sandaracinobacteroides saxicola]|uniref:Type II toxin-antitoxin system ParD family antitoxin n=1 Tax=Sandaracinobacteroides saxicola TaxID=2759707 RepID=A0A7G5IEK8_9SPHN|nr:type II toxin-antitoxin system ParD family antitoxin [Sandaracinobacteroides saxicola]QMW21800.1 type II toxin-antitoxin system ParD family antitoxin [Sandaracinobacteroides saxicola]
MSFVAPEDLAQAVEKAVAAGRYAAADEVMVEALEYWRERQYDGDADAWRRAIDAALADDQTIDGAKAFAELREHIEARARGCAAA